MKFIKILIFIFLIPNIAFSSTIWLEEAQERMNWHDAMTYCKERNAKLPSKKLFIKLWLENNKASDIKGFDLSVSYWTRDEVKNNKHAAYPFYFMEGRDTWYYKADKYGVRCIK
ncbi:hypothetical protein ACOJTA_01360 [Malaciobacter sp. WC5094]|uniref:hypothetical protein n=1 Tax=Arcobacter sp. YIC-80 TaxID=3376683 RepID=UPI00384BE614